ncbi:hypothetical protein PT974_03263 [Cladobotryum mycophilum]|uniref:Uncharacterized protein n=1 Tax=Cladobotryum mycophilum TaxID=491253 RepID=A0ABR0SSW9_9HYPO
MVKPTKPPANAFVAHARLIYNPIGFAKGYNFILWFILAGAMVGFVLARLQYLNLDGIFCKGEGAALCPASAISTTKPPGFIPAIRHGALIVHRINGYAILLLSLVGMAGVLMIARRSFAGELGMQTLSGAGVIIFLGSEALAYYNIVKLQLEQHRAWMIRAWVSAGFIITMRFISIIMASIIGTTSNDYYTARPCAVIDFILDHNQTSVTNYYPACSAYYSGVQPGQVVPIHADMMASDRPDQVVSALTSVFGSGGWIALALHLILAEVYLHLTPVEAERLRRVSYQRQLEAGMKNPGNAGLTVQCIGDAEPWAYTETQSSSITSEPDSSLKSINDIPIDV